MKPVDIDNNKGLDKYSVKTESAWVYAIMLSS